LDKLVCSECKAKILLIPDLKGMSKAINNHLLIHLEQMKKKEFSRTEIRERKKHIEEALLVNLFKAIYKSSQETESAIPKHFA
jgi:hypothetical protein